MAKKRNRKLSKVCPTYTEKCSRLSSIASYTFEEDLTYAIDSFALENEQAVDVTIPNIDERYVTDNRKDRSKRNKKNNDNYEDVDTFILSQGESGILFNSPDQKQGDYPNYSTEAKNGSQKSPLFSRILASDLGVDVHLPASTPIIENSSAPEVSNANPGNLSDDRLTAHFVSKNVINLSKKVLSKSEISLLSRGLKFCPTARELNKAQIKEDLEKFGRRIRLKWHFRNEKETFSHSPFKRKSTFNPPKGADVAIEAYLSTIEEQIMQIEEHGQNYSNLSVEEREALRNLKADKDIIIKSADKGSCIVVWGSSQLSDETVYQEIPEDPMPGLFKVVSNCLRRITERDEKITKEILDFLKVEDPKLCRLYLLPKVQKRMHSVPGRPIISNSGYITENISSFLDYHLQPLAKSVKSYLKDTNDFLAKIRDLPDLPENAILCTIDVVGLYPSIPNNEGLAALKKALDKRENPEVSTATLLDMAEVTLKNNYFEHDGKVYKQTKGTAMGTKFAPPYSIIYMGDFEESALDESELKPWVWWRYIDDIFIIWEHGEDKLGEFIDYLNSINPSIQFTSKYSLNSIEFLDVWVTKVGNGLKTSLFVKETDTHQYLHFSSCHVFHTKKAIPYGQALRLRRIISDDMEFEEKCTDLKSWLVERAYPEELVQNQINRAKHADRNVLLNKKQEPKNDNRPVLAFSYHPALPEKVQNIIRQFHPVLQNDAEHRRLFSELPLVTFRRAKSLSDMLVRAIVPNTKNVNGSRGCRGRSDCGLCDLISECNVFTNMPKTRSFEIRCGPLHCNSTFVVYLLECKKCNMQYIGSTITKMRLRVNNYKSQQKTYQHRADEGTLETGHKIQQKSLHAHFSKENGHCGVEDWKFTLIDQAPNEIELRKRELFWQHRLRTFVPEGLNERDAPTEITKSRATSKYEPSQ